MSDEIVWVPVTYKGAKFKAPFVMFAGWTMEQRKAYEKDLCKLRELHRQARHTSFGGIRGLILYHGVMSRVSQDTVLKTLAPIKGNLAKTAEGKLVSLGWDFERVWLDMQIGMVKVPELF
jgi:hypothetical protein